ncbi:hypothetical protein HOLleu_34105 [Holothuria leucospilota]|uniref:Uncharacterized protein n=1 Tax=Holothuria leucospilota TaxID=206669 RepID=A0A9Q1BI43_HOLLE|nr:hypothetical protein HOLleu_34105 [Holothuria leucospilota]
MDACPSKPKRRVILPFKIASCWLKSRDKSLYRGYARDVSAFCWMELIMRFQYFQPVFITCFKLLEMCGIFWCSTSCND